MRSISEISTMSLDMLARQVRQLRQQGPRQTRFFRDAHAEKHKLKMKQYELYITLLKETASPIEQIAILQSLFKRKHQAVQKDIAGAFGSSPEDFVAGELNVLEKIILKNLSVTDGHSTTVLVIAEKYLAYLYAVHALVATKNLQEEYASDSEDDAITAFHSSDYEQALEKLRATVTECYQMREYLQASRLEVLPMGTVKTVPTSSDTHAVSVPEVESTVFAPKPAVPTSIPALPISDRPWPPTLPLRS